MSDPIKRPTTPNERSHGDAFWVMASAVSAIVLVAGAGYHFWSTRGHGPTVGEKVEMPGSPARTAQRAGENLRGMFRGGPATRPGAARQPGTAPARN